MRDDLRLYYERELTYLRQTGAQFRDKYPKIASRLQLEPDKCEDPHVERLLEAFAFLAARVHLKIDDEFPEITEALLSIVYPHFIRPTPSMSIVEFMLDPEGGKLTTGLKIPKDSTLYSKPVDGTPCKFRTCYDLSLWPVTVAEASWKTLDRLQPAIRSSDATGAIRLDLRCLAELDFEKLEMTTLRFYLSGESSLVHTLYELLCCNVKSIMLRDPRPKSRVAPVTLSPSALTPVGFETGEGMLPYDRRSFVGYRLLQEYFMFPEKFFFFDLKLGGSLGGFKGQMELLFLLSKFEGDERRQRIESGIAASTFRLGCAPVVNLFPQTAEPILLDQQKYEYRIVPDARRQTATEIFSIDEVLTLDTDQKEVIRFHPFYALRHGSQEKTGETLWIANRRASARANDEGTEIDLSLVDLTLRPIRPETDTITVRTTCTNRDLPSRLPFGSENGDFELESGAPIKRIMAMQKPTPPIRPPLGKAMQWRLISHLSLNYLSLVENGKEALQEILKLYNFNDAPSANRVIQGIADVRSAPHFARVISKNGIAFARGTKIDIELDEEQFVGGGAYLFASVIEHFLSMYATLNSFSQLSATTLQRKEPLRQWPPRAGRKILM